jgi:hypothetical protein
LKVGAKLGGVLVAQVAIFLQALADNSLQVGWQVRVQSHCRCWHPVKNGFEDHSRAFTSEWQDPSRHLIEYCPEGKQIDAHVQFFGRSPNYDGPMQ